MRTYKIHLIRHALYEGSEQGRYIGHTDEPLSADGIAQLKDMQQNTEYPLVKAVISSPLDRCLQTAKILYPDLSPMIFDDLIEYDFGEFEGMTADELKNEESFATWLAGGVDAEAPFGESNGGFQKRVCACFMNIVDGILKAGVDNVAVITHGGVIMTIMSMFALPEAPIHEWMTPSCCGYTLNVIPSIWSTMHKCEAFAEVPLRPVEQVDEADGDWDKEIDPDEFIGFYTQPEE